MKTFPQQSSITVSAFFGELVLTFLIDKSPAGSRSFTIAEGFPESFAVVVVSDLTVDEVLVELSPAPWNVEVCREGLRSALEGFLEASEAYSYSTSNYKQDNGKLDYTLLMNDLKPQVEAVVKVLHWGHHTKGYPRQGYKTLPGGTDRLVAACYRHLAAMSEDFWATDEESGHPHAVHAVANILMAMSKGAE